MTRLPRSLAWLNRRGLRLLMAAALLAAALGFGQPLPALADSTITVNSTADTAQAGDGACTLREALLNANGNNDSSSGDCAAGSGADTITFGVTGTITLASALPTIADDLTLSGPGASQLTISGGGAVRVLGVFNIGVTVFLNGLTIANGRESRGAGIYSSGMLRISDSVFTGNVATTGGGAIYNVGAYMTVANSTFSDNNGATFGGGIYDQPFDPSHVLLISGSTFSNNTATLGGGIYALNATVNLSAEFSGNTASQGAGVYVDTTALQVSGGRFANNSASANGGGIYMRRASSLAADTTTFSGNSAGSTGGGIFSQGGSVTLQYDTFSNNDAGAGNGGGVAIDTAPLSVSYSTFSGNRGASGGGITASGTLTVNSSSFTDNQVTNSGGAITAYGATTIRDSSFTGNSATRSAGAIWNYTDASVLVRNSSVAGNSAGMIGGGLSNEGGALTLVNSTVANNTSGSIGGGIDNRGSVTAIHTTLSGNSASDLGSAIRNADGASVTLRNSIVAGSAAKANCSGSIADGGYNVDTGTSCGLSQANGSLSATNPQLDPAGLQLNGGNTKSIALQDTSPVLNLVPLASCTDQNGDPLTADQRSAGRPYGPGCDPGAYELQTDPAPPPPASADLRVSQSASQDPVVTDQNVTFTITASNDGPDAAEDVVVTEDIQQFANFDSASAGCDLSGTRITCSLGDLAAGASASVQVTISSPYVGAIVTVAGVSASTGDPQPTNNSFTARITVDPANQAPTDITLSNTSVAENSPLGTAVGTLSSSDPDAGDTHSYAIVANFSDGNAFTIDGSTLKTNTTLDYEAKSSYVLAIRSTDAGGLSFEKIFTISVADVNEQVNSAPTIVVAAGGSVSGTATGTINLSLADADGDSLTLSASSSNTALVPVANVVFAGSGASRTVRITAVPQRNAASATITISVSDGNGGTAATTITVLVGTSKKETLNGTAGADLIFGLAGNDTINAGAGNDVIAGGDGGDTLTGGAGADTFSGGAGKDKATDLAPAQGDTQDGTIP